MLQQLKYHEAIADWLNTNEDGVWDWFSNRKLQDEQDAETRDLLLQQTVRLTRETHSTAYACCETAMAKLGVDAPVTLYQAGDGAMNAALFFIPGEVHVVLYGPVLERLSEDELTALCGHEVSHYLLWTFAARRYRIAQQIIDDAVQQAPGDYTLYETARLFLLATEVFADRGAALACGRQAPAIAVLLKVMTGLAETDPSAFLEQAAELDAKGEISKNHTHPEVYLRALFIDRWWRERGADADDVIDDWVLSKIKGPMAIGQLDLVDQQRLGALTRQFFARLLHDSELASKMAVTLVRQFFPDWEEGETRIDLETLKQVGEDKSMSDYFIALIFDLAHADPEQTEEVLVRGAKLACSVEWEEAYRANLKSLLKMRKPQIDRIMRAAETVAWEISQ